MPAMSHSEEADKGDDCQFKWGKKRGVGGKKKEVQFYESFTYDGVEYFLYDCVCLYKEGEPEPYIGKLVKIWEQPENKKKIKALWFFRPIELHNFVEDGAALETELFLACGEGLGLANVNPLEAIVGKCNVICTSKDMRNPQPTTQDLEMADYTFYRTFDVGNCTISDKIGDKVAGVEAENIFNKNVGKQSSSIPQIEANGEDEKGKMNASELHLPKAPVSVIKDDGHLLVTDSAVEKDIDPKASSVIFEIGLLKDLTSTPRPLLEGKQLSDRTATSSAKQEHLSNEKTIPRPKVDYEEDETGKGSISPVEDKEKLKSVKNLGVLDDRPSKKARLSDNSSKPSENKQLNASPSLASDKDKNQNSIRKARVDSSMDDVMKASETPVSSSEDKAKKRSVRDSLGQEKGPSKKLKPETTKPLDGTGHKADGRVMDVIRRPDSDRSKWFKGLPWEERLQTAYEQGTLVLLENLDPAYTSTEVEDIVWHGFRENCTVKAIQRTTISSPHYGQAFVIFKSRDAAEMVLKNLDEGCLMLPNGRPLVGSKGAPKVPEKPSKFVGHLSIDKIKIQMQREEMIKAVSTSHCSQSNTIEYDMALDWRLLQAKFDNCWKDLYKKHGEELTKLKRNLKTK